MKPVQRQGRDRTMRARSTESPRASMILPRSSHHHAASGRHSSAAVAIAIAATAMSRMRNPRPRALERSHTARIVRGPDAVRPLTKPICVSAVTA